MGDIISKEKDGMSSRELIDSYLDYLDAKPQTVNTYARALRQFAKYLDANHIRQPVRSDVIAYRDSLRNTNHKATTIQNYMAAVRLFFGWAEQEKIYQNVAAHIKGASIGREHKKDYLTAAQVRSVLGSINRATLKGKRDYAIILLMATCGLRTVEISRASVKDMRPAGGKSLLYIQGKGFDEKSDFVILAPPAEDAIRRYLAARGIAQPDAPLFAGISNRCSDSRPMTTRSISRVVKDRFRAAGFDSETLTAHSLRHTAVTLALLAGNDLQDVQRFARHANIQTTEIYAHNIDRAQSRCETSISDSIFNENK